MAALRATIVQSASVASCHSAYHVVVINSMATVCPDPLFAARMIKRGFELRGVVKSLDFFCRHLTLLARCHLFGTHLCKHFELSRFRRALARKSHPKTEFGFVAIIGYYL